MCVCVYIYSYTEHLAASSCRTHLENTFYREHDSVTSWGRPFDHDLIGGKQEKKQALEVEEDSLLCETLSRVCRASSFPSSRGCFALCSPCPPHIFLFSYYIYTYPTWHTNTILWDIEIVAGLDGVIPREVFDLKGLPLFWCKAHHQCLLSASQSLGKRFVRGVRESSHSPLFWRVGACVSPW